MRESETVDKIENVLSVLAPCQIYLSLGFTATRAFLALDAHLHSFTPAPEGVIFKSIVSRLMMYVSLALNTVFLANQSLTASRISRPPRSLQFHSLVMPRSLRFELAVYLQQFISNNGFFCPVCAKHGEQHWVQMQTSHTNQNYLCDFGWVFVLFTDRQRGILMHFEV